MGIVYHIQKSALNTQTRTFHNFCPKPHQENSIRRISEKLNFRAFDFENLDVFSGNKSKFSKSNALKFSFSEISPKNKFLMKLMKTWVNHLNSAVKLKNFNRFTWLQHSSITFKGYLLIWACYFWTRCAKLQKIVDFWNRWFIVNFASNSNPISNTPNKHTKHQRKQLKRWGLSLLWLSIFLHWKRDEKNDLWRKVIIKVRVFQHLFIFLSRKIQQQR